MTTCRIPDANLAKPMTPTRSQAAAFAAFALLAVLPPVAQARAEPGHTIENVELATIGGGKAALLSAQARANVFIFFRPGQERSIDALKQMADCEKEFAAKSVHWAAVVSSSVTAAEVQAVVAETGIQMPVLVDQGDLLYNKLGIRLHPMVGIADAKFKLSLMEPYRQIQYCELVRTHIQVLLGEKTLADVEKVRNPDKSPLPGSDPMTKALRDVNMARRLVEIKQYDKAIKQANKALEIAPVSQAFVVMGEAYARLGKCPDSAKAIEQAIRLDPKNPNIAGVKALCSK